MNPIDRYNPKQKSLKRYALAFLIASGATVLSTQTVFAKLPYQDYQPAGQQVDQSSVQPPPIGNGQSPREEIGGDSGATSAPASKPVTAGNGTLFPTVQGAGRTTVFVYAQTYSSSGEYRGLRLVTTLRPDALSAEQIININSVLGIDMTNGDATMQITANDAQLSQLDTYLNPGASQSQWGTSQIESPAQSGGNAITSGNTFTMFPNGRSFISQDPSVGVGDPSNTTANPPKTIYPAQTIPIQINKPPTQNGLSIAGHPISPVLPFVFVMCRWLVIAGVVFATVKISLASYAVVMGHPYAGSRVIAAASGLLMLLSAFTIYKIVLLNSTHSNSSYYAAYSRTNYTQTSPLQTPNLPIVPTATPNRPARSGITVAPFFGN
jgi:hypothetical protein